MNQDIRVSAVVNNREENAFDGVAREFIISYIVPVLKHVSVLCMSSSELRRQMKVKTSVGNALCEQARRYGLNAKMAYQNGERVYTFWSPDD